MNFFQKIERLLEGPPKTPYDKKAIEILKSGDLKYEGYHGNSRLVTKTKDGKKVVLYEVLQHDYSSYIVLKVEDEEFICWSKQVKRLFKEVEYKKSNDFYDAELAAERKRFSEIKWK